MKSKSSEMRKIVFIADAFYEDIPQGGAELVNHLLGSRS